MVKRKTNESILMIKGIRMFCEGHKENVEEIFEENKLSYSDMIYFKGQLNILKHGLKFCDRLELKIRRKEMKNGKEK